MKAILTTVLLLMLSVPLLAEDKKEKSESKFLLNNVVYDEITIHAANGYLIKRVKKSMLFTLNVGRLPSGIYHARVEGIDDLYTFVVQ